MKREVNSVAGLNLLLHDSRAPHFSSIGATVAHDSGIIVVRDAGVATAISSPLNSAALCNLRTFLPQPHQLQDSSPFSSSPFSRPPHLGIPRAAPI